MNDTSQNEDIKETNNDVGPLSYVINNKPQLCMEGTRALVPTNNINLDNYIYKSTLYELESPQE